MKRLNLIGEKYGRLTVISDAGNDSQKRSRWLCKCDCGNESVVGVGNLRNGTIVSCGCKRREDSRARHILPYGEASFNHYYKIYMYGAKKRGFVFEISKDLFRKITQGNCHYCGDEPDHEYNYKGSDTINGPYVSNGIDRKDNSIGYTKLNVVACCKTCNVMKMKLGYDEFINHVNKINSHLKK